DVVEPVRGDGAQFLGGGLAAGHAVRGAEGAGGGQPAGVEVDGRDGRASAERGGDDGRHADRPGAEDRDGRAGGGSQHVEDAAGAGLEAAAERPGEQEVDVLADGNDGAGGHDHVVGERRLPEEVRVDLGAVHGDGRRAVGAPPAEVERVEPQAVAGRAGQAGATPAAGGERQRDVVAGRDGGDVVADLLDDSGALVAEDGGRLEEGGELEVGGADA